MKRISILFALLLFIGNAFSQSVNTYTSIHGLGNFYLGMDKKQVTNTLKSYTTAKTKISSNESLISASNIVLAETLFDNCSFFFENKELQMIILTLYSDDNNNELKKILSILENDYGKQENKFGEDSLYTDFRWKNDDIELILKREYSILSQKNMVTLSCINNNPYRKSTFDDEDGYSMGVRIGGGVSTLTNFDRSKIFQNMGNALVKERFAWDIGFSIQEPIRDDFFFLTEAIFGVSRVTIDFQRESINVDRSNFQSNNYLGKKFRLGSSGNFFIAMGLYIDISNVSESLYEIKTPEYILDNFKDFDLGATLQAGFEFDKFQLSINPQFGFLDLTRDRESKVYNRSLKLAVTYNFFMF